MSAKQSQMRHPLKGKHPNRFLANYRRGERLDVAGPQTLRDEGGPRNHLALDSDGVYHTRYQLRDGDAVVWAGYHDKAQNCLVGPALPEQLPPGRVPNQSDRAPLHNAVTPKERDAVCSLISWMREVRVTSDRKKYEPDEWLVLYSALLAEKGQTMSEGQP